jgi:drug/metabolite transporter (DMT)-like permease
VKAARGQADPSSIAALLAVQTLFGLHYLAAKIVLETIPPRPWSLIRAGSAALLLTAFVIFRGDGLPKGRRVLLRFAGLSLFGVAINQYLFVEGLHRSSPGHSALIVTSIPVLVVLIAVILRRERPTPRRLAGIAVTLLGVLVLIGPDRLDWRAESFRGDLLTAVNALSYAFFLVVGKPVFERERTLPASALLLLAGSVWLLPVGAPGLLALRPSAIGATVWLLAAFIILGPTIGAYALNTYALRRVDASVVAFFVYLQPLIGAGLSIGLGFERPTLRLLGAAAIVFSGVYVALRAPAVRAAPPLAPEP